MPEECGVFERIRQLFQPRSDRRPPVEPPQPPPDDAPDPPEDSGSLWGIMSFVIVFLLMLCGSIWMFPPTSLLSMQPTPSATLAPLAPSATAPPPRPTPILVAFGPLEHFEDPQGRFSISRPRDWPIEPKPPAVVFFRPQGQEAPYGLILINISQQGRMLTPDEALSTLLAYVQANFGVLDGFTIQTVPSRDRLGDPLVFSYDLVNLAGETVRTIDASAWIDQRDDLVSIHMIAIPSDQRPALAAIIAEIRASYQLR